MEECGGGKKGLIVTVTAKLTESVVTVGWNYFVIFFETETCQCFHPYLIPLDFTVFSESLKSTRL